MLADEGSFDNWTRCGYGSVRGYGSLISGHRLLEWVADLSDFSGQISPKLLSFGVALICTLLKLLLLVRIFY